MTQGPFSGYLFVIRNWPRPWSEEERRGACLWFMSSSPSSLAPLQSHFFSSTSPCPSVSRQRHPRTGVPGVWRRTPGPPQPQRRDHGDQSGGAGALHQEVRLWRLCALPLQRQPPRRDVFWFQVGVGVKQTQSKISWRFSYSSLGPCCSSFSLRMAALLFALTMHRALNRNLRRTTGNVLFLFPDDVPSE